MAKCSHPQIEIYECGYLETGHFRSEKGEWIHNSEVVSYMGKGSGDVPTLQAEEALQQAQGAAMACQVACRDERRLRGLR